MSAELYFVLKMLVQPPGVQAVAGLLGLLLLSRYRRAGLLLLILTIVSVWVMGMPAGAAWLARPLEQAPPWFPAAAGDQQLEVIIVLGAGSYRDAPESAGASEVSRLALERLRHGARLARETGLPLAVTGGIPRGLQRSEAEMMRDTLERDFGVTVQYLEQESRNTWENAQYSAAVFGFRRVLLVTHAVHMPRAQRAFEEAGFIVTPAPTAFISRPHSPRPSLRDFVPTAESYFHSSYAIHEVVGALWYRLRGG